MINRDTNTRQCTVALKRLSIAVASILMYSCTAQQIQYQALEHNQAFSSSADKILLTNIVRSSRILPVDYTAVTSYTGKEVVSGSLSGKLPFGAEAQRIFNLDPTVNMGPGIASLEIKDFAQQKESFTKLHEEVTPGNFVNLYNAGWNPDLIISVLIQNVRIRGEFARQVFTRSNSLCSKLSNKKKLQCLIINRSLECGSNRDDLNHYLSLPLSQKISAITDYAWYPNVADDKCKFFSFLEIMSRLQLLGIAVDIGSSETFITPLFAPDKKMAQEMRKIYETVNDELSAQNRVALEFIGRSTNLMVRFLGQIARAQLFLSKEMKWTPSIYLDEQEVPLFLIQQGDSSTKMAISTEFEGEVYGIPDPDYKDQPKHMGLYLFTYIRLRLDQAYAQTKLPTSNTLILR